MKYSRTQHLSLLGALLAGALAFTAPDAHAQIYYDTPVTLAPPDLPQYEQPPMPADGYLWTPGYSAWNPDLQGFYWIAGQWVQPPQIGYLWTPGYWTETDNGYEYVEGYWAQDVGFYGGLNYGYGYGGIGYAGAYWNNGALAYNRLTNNFGAIVIVQLFEAPTRSYTNSGHIAFNGRHGLSARPSQYDAAAAREQHYAATADQPVHTQRVHVNSGAAVAYVQEGTRVNAASVSQATSTSTSPMNFSASDAQGEYRVHPTPHAPIDERVPVERASEVPRDSNVRARTVAAQPLVPIPRPQMQQATATLTRSVAPVIRPPTPSEPLKKTP